jgi:hypothetical protein
MCPSGATVISMSAHYKNPTLRVGLVQSGPLFPLSYACSCLSHCLLPQNLDDFLFFSILSDTNYVLADLIFLGVDFVSFNKQTCEYL